MRTFRITMVQMNPTLGDLEGNTRSIIRGIKEARQAKSDAVVFPELAVTGYPPEDLLHKPRFLRDASRMIERIRRETRNVLTVVGCTAVGHGRAIKCSGYTATDPYHLYNAAAIMAEGQIIGTYAKQYLPNYGVFDERRYFLPGRGIPVFVVNGITVGVNICEDIWFPEGPTRAQTLVGKASVILNLNASPYQAGKSREREKMLASRAQENRVIVSYTNMVGGQDELIFDGNSVIVNQDGEILLRGKAFEEDVLIADLDIDAVREGQKEWKRTPQTFNGPKRNIRRVIVSKSYRQQSRAPVRYRQAPVLDPLEEVYRALVLGVRDYVRKNRFKKVIIGISGGIDSALTAVIARDAIGASNVIGVVMPSPYTSRASRVDAAELGRNLELEMHTVPIGSLFQSYLRLLEKTFKGRPPDTTEENIQARIRGNILMALSNKFGYLVLTTGNKSEMSVGYATLYGDMAGGFAVIKDVPKSLVFELTRWRNQQKRPDFEEATIPARIQERAPSAELKADQTDQDVLPPYSILDPILKAYIEDDCSPEEIVEMGFETGVVRKVVTMVDRSEYKRRQAPIGIKITARALGKDRRMPITNQYPHSF
ncbi:MAG: NAD+ synthase [Nitrospirota bacterium]|nr:MAG: NAD+ synthase [Nitrospirota bacterium]